MHQHHCRHCGKSFQAVQRGRVYCSLDCSNRGRVGCEKAKNGTGYVDCNGYKYIYVNGKRVKEHRHVMAEALGRPLLPYEVVHHKDGHRSNNAPQNLELKQSHAEHLAEHRTLFRSDTHKQCCECREIKSHSAFSDCRKTTDKKTGMCRKCCATYAAKRKTRLRGTCVRCQRPNLYLVTRGMCGGCNAVVYAQSHRTRRNELQRHYIERKRARGAAKV